MAAALIFDLPSRFFTAQQGAACHFESPDPEAAWAHMCSVFSQHSLRLMGDRNRFSAQVQSCTLGDLTLSTLAFGTEVELNQAPSRDFLLVSTQLAGQARIRSPQGEFEGGAGLIMVDTPHQPVVKRFSADSRRIHLRFDTRRVEACCASLLGHSLDQPLHFAPLIAADTPTHYHWLSLLRLLFSYLEHTPDCSEERMAPLLRHLEQAALLMLLQEHQHSYSAALAAPIAAVAPRHVRRAEAYMRAHAGEDLTLAQVAAAANVSVRALSQGFRSHRQTTVMGYLQELRLQGARDALQAGQGTVAQVAIRWGFDHLGRFAALYQRRYGERPSATLQGCRY